jgi:hypothetical protein
MWDAINSLHVRNNSMTHDGIDWTRKFDHILSRPTRPIVGVCISSQYDISDGRDKTVRAARPDRETESNFSY